MAKKRKSSSQKIAESTAKALKKDKKLATALIIILSVILVAFIGGIIILYIVNPAFFHIRMGLGEHSWTEYTLVREVDCGRDGVETRECKVCGQVDNRITPATLNHDFGDYTVTTERDCGHDGQRSRVCKVCSYEDIEILPATGMHSWDDSGTCTTCGSLNSTEGTAAAVGNSEFSIHFISFDNKNAGDCTLIKCGDTEVLIDAGSLQETANCIKTYVNKYCTDNKLEYVIATHSDKDHISALVGSSTDSGYDGVLYSYEIGTIIRFDKTKHSETTAKGGRSLYGKFVDAVNYACGNGAKCYTGLQCYNNADGASRTYYLDQAQTVSMNFLYNYYYDHSSSDNNNYSVCMLLSQEYGTDEVNHYLFTGDLEKEGEEKLVENNTLPQVKLFKAGHHGSYTASNDCLLSVIRPENVVVCCCAGTNEYTDTVENQFPSQAFIDRVSKYTSAVYCTNVISDNADGYEQMNGDVVFYWDGKRVMLYCSNNTTVLKDTEWFKANRHGWENATSGE